MTLPALLDEVRHWRYRTDWRGHVILQVRDERTMAAPSSGALAVSHEWRDARMEDLTEWGGKK